MTEQYTRLNIYKLYEDAIRQYTICNACRYCEGYCPVWNALPLRTLVTKEDTIYFAHLCFDKRNCYYACPYVSPHEFNWNIPRINREIRLNTYRELLGKRIRYSLSFLLLLPLIFLWIKYWPHLAVQYPILNFYNVVPRDILIMGGIIAMLYIMLLSSIYIYKFDRLLNSKLRPSLKTLPEAITDLLLHRWFEKAQYPKQVESNIRFIIHFLIFYGILLDTFATITAYIQEDILRIPSPYPVSNPAVIFGLTGGIMIVVGTIIAIVARCISRRKQKFIATEFIDTAFAFILLLTALSGLLVLYIRIIDNIILMNIKLIIHYNFIYILFFIIPIISTAPHILLRFYSYWIYKTEILKSISTSKH